MNSERTTPLTMACPSRDEWSAFYLGQLPDDAVQPLAEHLEQCSGCSSILSGLEGQADELLRNLRRSEEDSYCNEPACLGVLSRLRDLVAQPPAPRANTPRTPLSQRLGPYRLLRRVGEGNMGTVFQAHHDGLDRVVALKMLSKQRAGDPSATARFQREIAAIARLDHPHIIRATDAGECDGVLYLVMEFVEGTDLGRLLRKRGPLPVADACELIRQAALGLHHAHLHGLVHRDVKPSNILLSAGGQVKVLDLGLALPSADLAEQSALTSSGQVLGTLDYIAPEQCRDAHAVDARTDLYSLGCTLYQLLTGHVPFASPRHQSPQSKLWAHAFETPPSVRTERPDVSPELATLVERLLAKEPAARVATAADVMEALAPFAVGADLLALHAEREHEPAAGPATEPTDLPSTRLQGRRNKVSLVWWALTGVAAALLVGIVHFAANKLVGANRPLPAPVARSNDEKTALNGDQEQPAASAANLPAVHPTALFVFEERGAGAKEMGQKVADLLFAKLVAKDALSLVEREDLKKALAEAELNLSGAVKPGEATKVGQLTGAKLLFTGSVIHVDKKLYLVAKIIGTETGRVVGASVDGKAADELDALVDKLADKVAESIVAKSEDLVPKVLAKGDRVAALKEQLKKKERPTVMVKVAEKHLGAATIDPAAQTELMLFFKECGFEVIDADEGMKVKADVIITGEGISAFAARRGNLMTVKARLEIKAVERATDKVLAVDRQTVVVVDLTEPLAGKSALQEAAALIAERLLPKLAK